MQKLLRISLTLILSLVSFVFVAGCFSESEPLSNDDYDLKNGDKMDKTADIPDEENEEPATEEAEDVETFRWVTYTCKDHGLSIDYPDTWHMLEPSDGYPATFRPEQGTQTTIQVQVYESSTPNWSYDDHVSNFVERVKRLCRDAEFGELENVEINEHPFVLTRLSLDHGIVG